MISLLALDLGTHTGYAQGYLERGSITDCGTIKLATAKEIALAGRSRMNRKLDSRIPALYNWLATRYITEPFDWVVWEDVLFSSSTMQTQLWSSFRATVWLFASQRAVKVECCPVGTLKKFATGSGAADKDAMARALVRTDSRFTSVNGNVTFADKILTDDAVDAVHLLKWAQKILQNL